ncbi:MAG: hypothetical protein AB7S26_17545 [Sandaracinaceae bacterium]
MREHRVGDRVRYVYTGLFTDDPVTLEEEITEADGLRLTMTVQAHRGPEVRTWIQVVTDTAENRERNVVDELYEVRGSDWVRLANEDNHDLVALYGWTLPDCEPPVAPLPSEERTLSVGESTFHCDCER